MTEFDDAGPDRFALLVVAHAVFDEGFFPRFHAGDIFDFVGENFDVADDTDRVRRIFRSGLRGFESFGASGIQNESENDEGDGTRGHSRDLPRNLHRLTQFGGHCANISNPFRAISCDDQLGHVSSRCIPILYTVYTAHQGTRQDSGRPSTISCFRCAPPRALYHSPPCQMNRRRRFARSCSRSRCGTRSRQSCRVPSRQRRRRQARGDARETFRDKARACEGRGLQQCKRSTLVAGGVPLRGASPSARLPVWNVNREA